jgi:hypothetical protein
VVDDEPDVRDTYQNLRLRAESLALASGPPISVTGLALVRAPRYPARAYGERLAVSGELETPPVLDDFSYKDYIQQWTKRLCANRQVGTAVIPSASCSVTIGPAETGGFYYSEHEQGESTQKSIEVVM